MPERDSIWGMPATLGAVELGHRIGSSALRARIDPAEAAGRSREDLSVLIVDDEHFVAEFLDDVMRSCDFRQIHRASDGQEAIDCLERRQYDLIFLDLNMPILGGDDVLSYAQALWGDEPTILVITGYTSAETAVDFMKRGAYDFLVKPFSTVDLVAAIDRAVDRCWQIRDLAGSIEVIETLVRVMESRDPYLKNHGQSVRDLAVATAQRIRLDSRTVKQISHAALLHDVGKFAVREEILNKKGELTPQDVEELRRHPVASRDILRPVKRLEPIVPYVYHHHERHDGSGYPEGISGEEIPLPARIIAVADAYDAMTSNRAYRPALPDSVARNLLREGRGNYWDGRLVDVFLTLLEEQHGVPL
jgi:putative two-component system response regulator